MFFSPDYYLCKAEEVDVAFKGTVQNDAVGMLCFITNTATLGVGSVSLQVSILIQLSLTANEL